MWSYATSATSSGRIATNDRSLPLFHRLPAACPGLRSGIASPSHGWLSPSFSRYGESSAISASRRAIGNEAATPTCWRAPLSSYRPSMREPTTGPDLCSR